ncbi:MAG TPA: TonB-dependent receptor plug domain-containing protein [Bacteroidota bacterium]|nr:TonB-dependent receptor plug domain-containing protein [Bacteroidota bacterium]
MKAPDLTPVAGILAVMILLFSLPIVLSAQGKTLSEMSIEEVMSLKVATGSLTSLTKAKIPVSLTTITSEDIAVTPARNIADLIEIYVPGALWLNHTSPRIGIRGVIIDRNYKILMLVNGKAMNQEGAQGATLELSNWDLNDIERIEIIRGPGSVTYGPGAIAGVINIITKTASTSRGVSLGVEDNFTYDSKGGHVSYGVSSEPIDLYAYGSVRATGGARDADYFAINQNTGAAGYINPSKGEGVMPIFGDNFGRPQVKLHLDMNFLQEWRLWGRYTNSDQPALFRQTMTRAAGEQVPLWFTGQKGIVGVLENTHPFSGLMTLHSTLSYRSENYYDYWVTRTLLPYDANGFNSAHGPGNIVYAFSESELLAGSTMHLTTQNEKYTFAAGANYSLQDFGPGWGKNKMYMLSNDYKIPDGRYIEDVIAGGFTSTMVSVFGESNLEFHRLARLLVSARMDKHTYSTYFFSPRIGIISELDRNTILKVLWQRSLRMNTAEELYKEHLFGMKSNPEILNCVEAMCNAVPVNTIMINASVSYNWGEMVGFVYDPATIKGETKPIGKERFYTIEAEAIWKHKQFTVSVNHSYVKQLSWKNAPGITSQGMSYSDYHLNGLESTGNDLNNWANHATKVVATCALPYHFTVHADGQVFWAWNGYRDIQSMYGAKYGTGDPAWQMLDEQLQAEDFAHARVNINVSVSKYLPFINSTVSVYGMNLAGGKRYSYSSGEKYNYPSRVMWVKEPAAVGMKLQMQL